MKIKMHKINWGLWFCLALITLSPVWGQAKNAEHTKEFHKSYKVGAKHTLQVENRFGSVNISSWDKLEVKVDVEIMVEMGNDKKAQELLESIEIKVREGSDLLQIKTFMGDDKQTVNLNGKRDMEINYEIKLPKSLALELRNKFGDITLDELEGRAEIELQFGSAKIGSLRHEQNELTFKFSDPVIIDEIGGGDLKLKFSKLELGSSGSLNFDSQMSSSNIGKTKGARMKVSYGSLDLESITDLQLTASMSAITVEELLEGGVIDVQYGKLSIEKLAQSFKGLEISGSFTPISIETEEGSAFVLDANTSMSNLDLPSGYRVVKGSEITNNQSFDGIIGKDREGLPVLKVKNSFGKIEIK